MKDYKHAIVLAMAMTLVSGFIFMMMPKPIPRVQSSANISGTSSSSSSSSDTPNGTGSAGVNDNNSNIIKGKKSSSKSLLSLLYLPAAQSPGARLLFFMRLLMGLAFNVFMTVWTVSLKQRFDFGPKDHAYFMGQLLSISSLK